MTTNELLARFPEIPPSMRDDPLLSELARVFDGPLSTAVRPTNCAGRNYSAEQRVYNALIMPMDILNVGLVRPEAVKAELRAHIDSYGADPGAWAARFAPAGTPGRSGGCA